MTLPPFKDFYADLHDGRSPYAWQERAASELLEIGWWPALRAPTGAGKTSLMACWLYAVAQGDPDRLGRRLAWVVDRRSVVDQVHRYAEEIVAALVAAPSDGAAGAVRAALQSHTGGTNPTVALWRGGLDDEGAFALRDPLDPAGVTIVVSTVDQVGSRLLFRGYGLSAGARALHAGLLGLDTTIVVDEAHIAAPLLRTASEIADRQARAPGAPRLPLRVCAVSATHEAPQAFTLGDEERGEPAIAQRLASSKPARLLSKSEGQRLPRAVEALAKEGACVIGVVLNTVGAARAAFEELSGLAPQPLEDRVLLIGPVRPLDRLDLIASIPDRAERASRTAPFVVVATQTIEVGVDLDFDGLVAAAAPLDALVQRFGRLDRAGALGHAPGAIIPPPSRGDVVYGRSADDCWAWMTKVANEGVIDFGVEALARTIATRGRPPEPEPVRTIHLLDEHIAALEVTDAADHEGPAVELLLHGDRTTSPEVAVAWRRLPEGPGAADVAGELEARPLHPVEILPISLRAFARWLTGAADEAAALGDVEGHDAEAPTDGTGHGLRSCWAIREGEPPMAIVAGERIPVDARIVVDVRLGGADEFGWAPASRAPVSDLGSLAARGPRVVLDAREEGETREVFDGLAAGELTAREAATTLRPAIEAALPTAPEHRPLFGEAVAKAFDQLVRGRASALDEGRILVTGSGARATLSLSRSARREPVLLDDHQHAVASRVEETARRLLLRQELVDELALAGRHHDEGKRDARFQAWLRGGTTVRSEDLAKSTYSYDPARVTRLRESAGWPAGKRHELVSAAALQKGFPDRSLSAWLIATHHGRNRPFAAAVDDEDAPMVEAVVDGARIEVPGDAVPAVTLQLATLAALREELGPWGLAFLEALLITADRRISAEEDAG